MKPKEKALELFEKYDNYPLTYEWKKQCTIIAVDEIIEILTFVLGYDNKSNGLIKYYQEVKQEIEKL